MSDQSEKSSYRLISGSFSPADAREVLMVVIDDKINFHRRKNWSRRERFGEVDAAGVKRIDELLHTRADLSQLIEDAAAAGMTLRINCDIDIQLVAS